MAQPSLGPAYPSTAYILSLIGGILITLSGLVTIVEALLLSSTFEAILPGITGIIIAFGVVVLLFGIVIIFLALRLKSNPASAHGSGVLILILSLLSIIGGGGFYFIGLILGLIGGILAMTWKAPAAAPPAYGQPGYGAPPLYTPAPGVPAAPVPTTAPQRFCASCGSPNVATAQFCAKCGAPMP